MKFGCSAQAPLCWARGIAQCAVSLGIVKELEDEVEVRNVEVKCGAAYAMGRRWQRHDSCKMGAQTRCTDLSRAWENVAFKCAGHAVRERKLCAEGLLFTHSPVGCQEIKFPASEKINHSGAMEEEFHF